MPNDAAIYDFLGQLAEQHQATEVSALSGPYKAGEINRLNKNWQPLHYSGEGAVGESWDLLTARIRDLGRNDPAIIGLKSALLNHVISIGIGTAAGVVIDGELAEDFNEEADEEFDWWAEQECDVAGKLALAEIEWQVFEEILDTGEGLLLRCQKKGTDRSIPLCYQVLEAEQIDASKDQPAGDGTNEIRRGIELDRNGEPLAYWLFDAHPADPHASLGNNSSRVPADRVIHLTLPGRPSQTRGLSLYRAITQSARDLDNYLGSELTSATIASLLSIVHLTGNPGAGMGFVGDGTDGTPGSDEFGNPTIKLGRGIVSQIDRKDDIKVVKTERPNASADTFVRLILLMMGMGGGVSRYRLTRDYTGTTFIAARAARLDDSAAFRPMQRRFGRGLVLPVYQTWTREMAARGNFRTLSATQFRRQQRRWQRVELLFPGGDDLDPEKATDADVAAIAAGTETLESVNARKGRHWRRVLRQRAREVKYAKSLGLELNYDRPSTPAKPREKEEVAEG